jgi:CAP-Gly domain-containing linker protein 1
LEAGVELETNLYIFEKVDFLNSVIVDMQRKNDELKAKLDLLESAGVFEAIDINDLIIMNGVDRGKVAPRLFCDICDRCVKITGTV